MSISWLFGNSLGQHHLLWTYLSVWIIQGGYAGWIGWHWLQSKKNALPPMEIDSVTREDA